MARPVAWPQILFVFHLRCQKEAIDIWRVCGIDKVGVSSRIATLEKEYGVVFRREDDGSLGKLTEAGTTLKNAVSPIVNAWTGLGNVVGHEVSIQQVLAALAVEGTGTMFGAAVLLYGKDQVNSIGELLAAVDPERRLFNRHSGVGSIPTEFYYKGFVDRAWQFIDACVGVHSGGAGSGSR